MGQKVAIDTPVFVYYLERHPRHGAFCHRLMAEVEQGKTEAVTSTLCMSEALIRPLVRREERIVHEFLSFFRTYPNLTVRSVDFKVALLASELRAELSLRIGDSVIAATALDSGCERLVTNDRDLRVLEEKGIDVEIVGLA